MEKVLPIYHILDGALSHRQGEWLYSEKFGFPKDSDNPSLLVVKVFCFAERDRATEQHVSLPTPNTTYKTYTKPQTTLWSAQQPIFNLPQDQTMTTGPGLKQPVVKYLPPATSSAIDYACQNILEHSPLRKLLTDIFAYKVKPKHWMRTSGRSPLSSWPMST